MCTLLQADEDLEILFLTDKDPNYLRLMNHILQ